MVELLNEFLFGLMKFAWKHVKEPGIWQFIVILYFLAFGTLKTSSFLIDLADGKIVSFRRMMLGFIKETGIFLLYVSTIFLAWSVKASNESPIGDAILLLSVLGIGVVVFGRMMVDYKRHDQGVPVKALIDVFANFAKRTEGEKKEDEKKQDEKGE